MHIVYVLNKPPETYAKSLFLAGPSPRDADHPNWRPAALHLLEGLGYDGVVFVPLTESGDWCGDKETQYAWEQKYLDAADQIVFWVPRDMATMPGLTTNVEFGMYYDSGRIVLGYPKNAAHTSYLDWHAKKEHAPIETHTLLATLEKALREIGEGAVRTNGERDVPLNIWRTPHFQSWYQAQVTAGNRLDGARPLWTCRVGQAKNFLFAYALAVNVHVTSEGRNKVNEFILSRPDVSTIVAYRTRADWSDWSEFRELLDTEIVIVREFRSPASIGDCMVREVPGGSSWKPGEDPFDVAAHELAEETGLTIEPRRLRLVGTRQIGATLSAHRANTFSCALTDDEMRILKAVAVSGQVHGVEADSERTYVEVRTVRELLAQPLTDWANLGMIFHAVATGAISL